MKKLSLLALTFFTNIFSAQEIPSLIVTGDYLVNYDTTIVLYQSDRYLPLTSEKKKEIEDMFAAQNLLEEGKDAKVSIGKVVTNIPSVLVLEDTDKAMVLSKVVDPSKNIPNPSPGMMVYDPEKKLLCIFNGGEWAYWKASN